MLGDRRDDTVDYETVNMTENEKRESERLRLMKTVTFTAVTVMAIGCGMLLAAMAIPPPGEIHNSILVAFGEISTFAGALLGVKMTIKNNTER